MLYAPWNLPYMLLIGSRLPVNLQSRKLESQDKTRCNALELRMMGTDLCLNSWQTRVHRPVFTDTCSQTRVHRHVALGVASAAVLKLGFQHKAGFLQLGQILKLTLIPLLSLLVHFGKTKQGLFSLFYWIILCIK